MGLFKLLLTGEDEELEFDRSTTAFETLSEISSEDEFTADRRAGEADQVDHPFLNDDGSNGGYDPEVSIRKTLAQEAAEGHQRDALLAQVGQLHLAVESLLRLLTDKGIVTDLDLRRMTRQVDLEDGLEDGEFHGRRAPAPSHCPNCEARVLPGKRMCVLCGHRMDAE
ncbi:MAG TPA: hypothetical protein VK137_16225 [Planctomycetaceae bacterium]|nr:hypothetical protein [Planctomycetaceae bacterium]